MILYQKPYITIEQDDQLKCLIQNWKGFANSENFRDAINQSLDIFKKGGLDKIISNTKDAALVSNEDTKWVAKEITPQMVKHGLRYMAFILPTNVFTQMGVENFKENAGSVVSIRYFDQMEAAKEWISESTATV